MFSLYLLTEKKTDFITEIRFFFFINYFAQGQLRSYRDLREVEA